MVSIFQNTSYISVPVYAVKNDEVWKSLKPDPKYIHVCSEKECTFLVAERPLVIALRYLSLKITKNEAVDNNLFKLMGSFNEKLSKRTVGNPKRKKCGEAEMPEAEMPAAEMPEAEISAAEISAAAEISTAEISAAAKISAASKSTAAAEISAASKSTTKVSTPNTKKSKTGAPSETPVRIVDNKIVFETKPTDWNNYYEQCVQNIEADEVYFHPIVLCLYKAAAKGKSSSSYYSIPIKVPKFFFF